MRACSMRARNGVVLLGVPLYFVVLFDCVPERLVGVREKGSSRYDWSASRRHYLFVESYPPTTISTLDFLITN